MMDSVAPAGDRLDQRFRGPLEAALSGRADIPLFVNRLLAAAALARASDIHLQPLEITTRISMRVSGELEEAAAPPQAHHEAIVRRLKILANLVPYETRKPQDGRFTFDSPRGSVDLRMSVMPTGHGEKVVLRLMQVGESLLRINELGMDPATQQSFEELLRQPQGVIVLTGPTGSGKTTTLYSALQHIHESRGTTTQLATLEDPIEIELPFASQTQIQQATGLGFQDALRAVLRQDPNVVMIGEIRDAESARIAIQAGLSGHLILTSLHADSAVGVFPRLIDLGVEPFLAASALLATVSQRLVRCLCPQCRHSATLNRRQAKALAERRVGSDGLTFYVSEGCRACKNSGIVGRKALFEILRVSPQLRQEVTSKASIEKLQELARAEGMKPLLEAAIAEAAHGTVAIDETLRIT
jgi:general secretion pathway protein E